MLPADDIIYECPYCGAEKALLQLASGNTMGGVKWWDFKSRYPMLPEVSPIQRCPKCGKYYPLSAAKSHQGTSCFGETGDLTYEEAREAWTQLKDDLDDDDLGNLLLICLQTYNDVYQRVWGPNDKDRLIQPTPGEKAYIKNIVNEIIRVVPVDSELFHAEFLREVGEFERAAEILQRIGKPTDYEFRTRWYEKLEQEIRNKDSRVTRMNG